MLGIFNDNVECQHLISFLHIITPPELASDYLLLGNEKMLAELFSA